MIKMKKLIRTKEYKILIGRLGYENVEYLINDIIEISNLYK